MMAGRNAESQRVARGGAAQEMAADGRLVPEGAMRPEHRLPRLLLLRLLFRSACALNGFNIVVRQVDALR